MRAHRRAIARFVSLGLAAAPLHSIFVLFRLAGKTLSINFSALSLSSLLRENISRREIPGHRAPRITRLIKRVTGRGIRRSDGTSSFANR